MNCFFRTLLIVTLMVWAAALLAAQTADTDNSSGEPRFLSCSPAPCVLTPVQASPGGVIDAPIASDPANPREILVGSATANCLPTESLAFYTSLNAGSSWNDTCMSAIFFDGQTYFPNFPSPGPILAYDHNGAAYIAGLYANSGDGDPPAVVGFERSTDGINWPRSGVALARDGTLPSYCWMAADANAGSPYVNSIYVSCVMVGPPFQFTQNQVVVSHSNDGGLTWHITNVAPIQEAPDEDWYTVMTVGKDGTVYLTWQACNTSMACLNSPVYMAFSKSTDGGVSWSKPKLFTKVTTVYPIPNTKFGDPSNIPAIAVDNSDGPYSGNLYVVMYNWTGSFMEVVVARSTDGGTTWSKPVPVAPGITHDQFLPWIAVSPTGVVGVTWADRRNDPNNVDYQAFAAISADGGLTFQPNVQLTTAFSNPNTAFGDYDGAAWDGSNYFLAAWMDSSNGVNAQDFVGGIRLK